MDTIEEEDKKERREIEELEKSRNEAGTIKETMRP